MLSAGFGGVLAITALSGVDASRVLHQIRREDHRIRRQFLYRNHVLNDIRSQLYLSGTYVRDYLLEPDAAKAEAHRASLEQVRRETSSALESYGEPTTPERASQFAALKSELSQYWDTLGPALKWSAAERHGRGYAFLRDQVFPRRMTMLGIAGRIAEVNEEQLNAGNDRVVSLLSNFQTRLGLVLVATLALGVGMSAFSMRRILSLETGARDQYRAVAQARGQLKDLSARLVQAQETERRALSRELHDEVGQALSAVLVELRNLAGGLGAWPPEMSHGHVDLIKGLVEDTVRSVRNMALLLRPSMLDDLGLIPALRWQARELSKRTSMDVNVVADLASDDLPDEYKTCVYRVVQEALHNCSRHSHAATVRIRVGQDLGRLSLSIQDDGQGFDAQQSKGLGLLGMEERVTRLGGRFEVHSKSGSGTVLAVELPLAGSQESGDADHADSHSFSG